MIRNTKKNKYICRITGQLIRKSSNVRHVIYVIIAMRRAFHVYFTVVRERRSRQYAKIKTYCLLIPGYWYTYITDIRRYLNVRYLCSYTFSRRNIVEVYVVRCMENDLILVLIANVSVGKLKMLKTLVFFIFLTELFIY